MIPINNISKEEQAAIVLQRQFRNKCFQREINYRIGRRLSREARDYVAREKGYAFLFSAAIQKHPKALTDICDRSRLYSYLFNLSGRQKFEIQVLTYHYLKDAARQNSPEAKAKFVTYCHSSKHAQLCEAIHYFSGLPSIYERDDEAFAVFATMETLPHCSETKREKIRTLIQNNLSRLENILRNQVSSSDRKEQEFECLKLYIKKGGTKLNSVLVYNYINSHQIAGFKLVDFAEDLLQMQFSKDLNDTQRHSIVLYFAYMQWEGVYKENTSKKFTNEQMATIFLEAKNNQCLSIRQRRAAGFALAMLCYKGESNLLTVNEVAQIFKDSCSLPYEIIFPTDSTWEFEFLFISDDAKFALATLVTQKQTDLINDLEVFKILLTLKNSCEYSLRHEAAKLLEKLYLEKRIPCYQTLTIANNTKRPLRYIITFNNNPMEFILKSSDRKIFEDLRSREISHTTLKVYNTAGEILAALSHVDMNSYVACFEPINFKCEVYYEPDYSEDAREPNSEMIRIVAAVLAQDKARYPSMSTEEYIESLGCDVGGERYNQFTRDLNNLMRPQQLKKAIHKIFNGDL